MMEEGIKDLTKIIFWDRTLSDFFYCAHKG